MVFNNNDPGVKRDVMKSDWLSSVPLKIIPFFFLEEKEKKARLLWQCLLLDNNYNPIHLKTSPLFMVAFVNDNSSGLMNSNEKAVESNELMRR